MSANPINFSQYESQAAKPIDFSGYEAKPAAAKAPPKAQEQPGFFTGSLPTLGREVSALGSALNPISLGKQLYHAAADPATDEEKQRFGNDFEHKIGPVGRLIDRSVVQPTLNAGEYYNKFAHANPDQRSQMESDMLGVAPEAIGGAGGTAIAGKVADSAIEKGKNLSVAKATSPIRGIARIANKAPGAVGGTIGGGVGAAVGHATGIPYGTLAGEELGRYAGRTAGPKILARAERIGLPDRVTGGPKIAPPYEPPATYPGAPLPAKPLGVELNTETPHAIPAAKSGEALSAIKTPQRLIAKPEAFRSRSIGEEGIPYHANSGAQASMSEDEARGIMPDREGMTGQPQELIGVDLSQAPGFSTKPGPRTADWVKFHSEIPESAIRRISSSKPSTIDTSNLGNLLNEGTGGKLPTVSGKLESSVPLKEQLSNSPAKSSLPQGFTPVKSSALQGYKYDPATQHFEVITTGGARHGIQGISPEDFDTFKNSDSLGKAWNQLKKSPGVIKTKNGTPRAIPLEYRSASPDDLTPELEESLKQAKAAKEKR